jgi:N-methylhydantoinase A/oxoprolinase/acetone carboxylase beta subunit
VQSLFDSASGQRCEAQVVPRVQLIPCEDVPGPALISEDQTTTVVPPGWVARLDEDAHIVMRRNGNPDND